MTERVRCGKETMCERSSAEGLSARFHDSQSFANSDTYTRLVEKGMNSIFRHLYLTSFTWRNFTVGTIPQDPTTLQATVCVWYVEEM